MGCKKHFKVTEEVLQKRQLICQSDKKHKQSVSVICNISKYIVPPALKDHRL